MRYTLFITFLLAAVTLSAQKQDPQAADLLKQLGQNHKSYETITADFTFHYKNLQSDSENQWNGEIIMKGDKYKLKLHHSTVYYNGSTLWNYLHEANEVNISEPPQKTNSDIINHPHQIFDIYKMNYKYKYLGNQTKDNTPVHAIDLFPEKLEQDYSRIRLYLTRDNIRIHSAKVFAKDGSRYRIAINNMKTDQPMDDSTFVFNKKNHPDAEVIDMRF